MILGKKTLEKLRDLINEGTEYRSGPKLVRFFNDLGFNDAYAHGFPSRWAYTDDRLGRINGSPELDKCIKVLLAPVNFVGRIQDLDAIITDFNQYLAFDKWQIIRENSEITFKRLEKIVVPQAESSKATELTEDQFLNQEFKNLDVRKLQLDDSITNVLVGRLEEIRKCLTADCPYSVIFLCGSSLEGILLGAALKRPKEFNQSTVAPRTSEDKVKQFPEWTLSNFIDAAYSIGFLKEDIKKFSHSLRDFRNYIHPYQQSLSQFDPDIHTAKISWQVLKAAIFQLQSALSKP